MIKKIDFRKIFSNKAKIKIWEKSNLKFIIKRVYIVNNTNCPNKRHGHAHKKLNQILTCLNGSIKIKLYDGSKFKSFGLNKKSESIFIKKGLWREITYVKKNSILMVFCDAEYKESDYIRDFSKYKKWKKSNS